MGVRDEFIEHNFLRETHCNNRARKIAYALRSQISQLFPARFNSETRITAINNQGWSNTTLLLEVDADYRAYILRLSRRCQKSFGSRSVPNFEKERYVLDKLAGHGFVPELGDGATGVVRIALAGEGEIEFGYLLQTYLPYRPGSAGEVARSREYILKQLGEILRVVHSIPVEGFGLDFSEAPQRFSFDTFSEWIASQMVAIESAPVDSYLKSWLSSRVADLARINTEPRLYHRDLLGNWGNLLVDGDSAVRGIIDWEFAGSGAAFQCELASMIYAFHRDGVPHESISRDIAAVLRGYQMSYEEYVELYQYDVETVVLLNSVSALIKFDLLKRAGATEREPWRQVFAERAQGMCRALYAGEVLCRPLAA